MCNNARCGKNVRLSPGTLTTAALVIAVIAVSSSGPLIAYAAVPALVIAFWRNAIAAAVIAPISVTGRRSELHNLVHSDRRAAIYCALAGLALAAHFAAWMPSVQWSTVATATALVATQPIWQGLIALGQGRRLSTSAWLGIGAAVLGAAVATGADFSVSAEAVLGDVLALLGGVGAAVYTALGERARSRLSTVTYTSICYGVCAAVLVVVCLSAGLALTGYDRRSWAAILALAAGAQLLGHSMFNYVLQRVSATTISMVVLLEVPAASLLAWVWLGQRPRLAALPGLVLILAGVATVVLGAARTRSRELPVSAPGGDPG